MNIGDLEPFKTMIYQRLINFARFLALVICVLCGVAAIYCIFKSGVVTDMSGYLHGVNHVKDIINVSDRRLVA
jgi:hypothetical protein